MTDPRFDLTADHRQNGSMRWQRSDGRADVIGMNTADLDYPCPPSVKEATRAIWEENTFNYRYKPDSYFEAILGWYRRQYGLELERGWLYNVPSTLGAVQLALERLAAPGDAVLVHTPCFGPIQSQLRLGGYRMVESPLRLVDGRYEMDLADFEKTLKSERPKVFLMVNPHNPTGRVFTKEELTALVDLCDRYGAKIVSDEVHSLILHGCRHTPILAVSERAQAISVQVVSMSKGFNLMGLPHAIVAVADPVLREKMAAAVGAHSFGYASNAYCIAAVTAVLDGRADDWLRDVTAYIGENIKAALAFFKERLPQLVPIAPEGSFLLWLDCRALGLPPAELDRFFLDKAGIDLSNGASFGPEGEGFVRLNLAVTRATLEEALSRIERAVKG
ncbi:MAG: aminotransferase class I/II-fold pyridoxal phosphate-dependent enzyme [Clostridia bacterium]|nr:aminotransferase class I/II-fold pyridoxal phosphate-dependent enzyme [Clostridia bacterium]